MNNELIDQYLVEFQRELKNMSFSEKHTIVQEVREEIQRKLLASNLPITIVLNKLGTPRELAKTYGLSHNEAQAYPPKNLMESYVYFGWADIIEKDKRK